MQATAAPARVARVLIRTAADLTLNVAADGVTDRVTVTRLGRAGWYAVEWFGHDRREVYLSDLPRGRHVCPCPGHCYRDRCRHVALLLALAARDELPR